MTSVVRTTCRWTGLLLAVAALIPAACSQGGGAGLPAGFPAPPADPGFRPVALNRSWAPAPRRAVGLSVLADADGGRFRLHTAGGEVDFLAGVNLGATVPGHQPGELALEAADYRRWFPEIAELGFRSIRIYTIHPPAFYSELARYNRAHAAAPLYLVQGVYLPDESYVEKGDLYDPAVTTAMRGEILEAVAAVHGDLVRSPRPGRASGRWSESVAEWVAGWIYGAELDPYAVRSTDAAHAAVSAAAPAVVGTYFRSTPDATPTERWLGARMEELAGALASRGYAAPLAFINWPTLDPLRHPTEPREGEDLVPVDANHLVPTTAWPAGTFASYHIYPYYPDFLRYEPEVQVSRGGRTDPYAGYLRRLRAHHGAVPMIVSEFGVPSSLGNAHAAPLQRDQGGHSESEMLRIDADLLDVIREEKVAGAFLFSWTDEWFKRTWNTTARQIPADRRQLWHDVLTNEQFFGVLATDPLTSAMPADLGTAAGVRVSAAVDPSYVRIVLHRAGTSRTPVRLGLDVIPGGPASLPGSTAPDGASDVAVVVDVASDAATVWVRSDQDLARLEFPTTVPAELAARCVKGWCPQILVISGETVDRATGTTRRAEYQPVGTLREGVWDPASAEYDNRSTWRRDDAGVELRLPWGLLGIGDPSSRTAVVVTGSTVTGRAVPAVGVRVDADGVNEAVRALQWQPWDRVSYRERRKPGIQPLVDALGRASGSSGTGSVPTTRSW
ncbi:MAG: hypothetical protein QG622_1838 [Actinomycetota bacterium]|nr:hypothetical protein [Actinomycetota bacterium]